MSIRILGTGSYLPDRLMTNGDFEKIIDTSDEWITTRTGIKRRHYVDGGMGNADLCKRAAEAALAEAGLAPADLGGIIVATVTGEMAVPSTASQLQRAFDIPECFAFDVGAACSGFVYALKIASRMAEPGGKPVLVCGSETLSRFMNMEDRGSCVLFGDGAGCVIVEAGENLKYLENCSKPDHNHTIEINGMNTITDGEWQPSLVSLKGKEVYAYSTREVERIIKAALSAVGWRTDEVDWFALHQANVRIIKAAAQRLDIPMEKCYVNIDDVANTSAASVPIALDQMNKKGLLKPGDKLMIAAFGGGLTSGCAAYVW
jgi:3-oxoacyl-[acyl-carrier-protein] synthase-3